MRFSWSAFKKLLFIAALIGAATLTYGSLAFAQPNANTAQVTVNPDATITNVPPGFAGLALSVTNVCNFASLAKHTSKVANLLANLGPSDLRMEGDTLDINQGVPWSPTGTPVCSLNAATMTQSLVDDIFSLMKQVNWSVLWGENILVNSTSMDAAESAYVTLVGGSNLLAFELGNEPDIYKTIHGYAPPWQYTDYRSKWNTYARAIQQQSPNAPFSAGGFSGTAWLNGMLRDEGATLGLGTMHLYPLGADTSIVTIDDLLSANTMRNIAGYVNNMALIARAENKPLRIDESNQIANGGTNGVSNVFASSLWTLDYLYTAAEQKAVGVNLSGNAFYEPLHYTATTITPEPEYYGMLAFHNAVPDGRIVSTSTASALNIASHAVVGADGNLRVTIINKDQTHPATVGITTTNHPYGSASALLLTAPSVTSNTNITFGGSAVAADGSWAPTTHIPVSVTGTASTVTVPTGSAVVITYSDALPVYTPTPTIFTPTPTPAYKSVVLADQPVAYYRLDEPSGTTAINLMAPTRRTPDGTYLNGPKQSQQGALVPSGDLDAAVLFNGTNQAITIPYTIAFNIGTFSVETWLYPTAASSTYQGIIASQNNPKGFVISITPDNHWALWINNGSAMTVVKGPAVVVGRWTHLVATFDGVNATLSIDDVNGHYAPQSLITGYTANATNAESIGQAQFGTAAFFAGKIDEVAFYNYALTPTQIMVHYFAAHYRWRKG